MKRLLLLVLLAAALVAGSFMYRSIPAAHPAKPAPAAGATKDGGPTAAEREAVARALAALPKGTRLAKDEDGSEGQSRSEMESTYANYHPYFVRGDLDGDGLLDFAQAFVVERSGRLWFDVAVFFGRAGGTFAEPVYVEKGISLADGDIAIERSILVITPDLEREETRRWRWEPEEHRFADADATPYAGPDDEDAPDETPEERPRVRV